MATLHFLRIFEIRLAILHIGVYLNVSDKGTFINFYVYIGQTMQIMLQTFKRIFSLPCKYCRLPLYWMQYNMAYLNV